MTGDKGTGILLFELKDAGDGRPGYRRRARLFFCAKPMARHTQLIATMFLLILGARGAMLQHLDHTFVWDPLQMPTDTRMIHLTFEKVGSHIAVV